MKYHDLGSYKAELGVTYTGTPGPKKSMGDLCEQVGRVADAAWSIVFLLGVIAGLLIVMLWKG